MVVEFQNFSAENGTKGGASSVVLRDGILGRAESSARVGLEEKRES